ncbi:MAG TPA: hypothetical protein VFY25_10655 [Anaerolineales bacterium]|nr:hypothetical protein [Anaerolineales bacterium]
MVKLYRYFCLFVAAAVFISGCATPAVQAQQAAPQPLPYTKLLGKDVGDRVVADFFTTNNCTTALPFTFCKEAGLAFWVAADQTVKQIYFYLNNIEGFEPYQGELPFGLKFYDTLGAVEYKLGRQGVGNSGLPDETGAPDHVRFWATYRQAGMTIIYNSPFADEDATIYAILLNG